MEWGDNGWVYMLKRGKANGKRKLGHQNKIKYTGKEQEWEN